MLYVLGLCYPLMSTTYQAMGFNRKIQNVIFFAPVRMFRQDGDYLIASIILQPLAGHKIRPFLWPSPGKNAFRP